MKSVSQLLASTLPTYSQMSAGAQPNEEALFQAKIQALFELAASQPKQAKPSRRKVTVAMANLNNQSVVQAA